MKNMHTFATLLAGLTLLFASCGKDAPNLPGEETGTSGSLNGSTITLTFQMSTPAGDKIIYSKATQDASEYAINSLSLYEYAINEGTSSFVRALTWENGGMSNTLDVVDGGNGTYTISLEIPVGNIGKQFTYRFVANETPATPDASSTFETFQPTVSSRTLSDNNTADVLCAQGIVMSGVAIDDAQQSVITIAEDMSCSVAMKRIVARIDVENTAPNLKITGVTLQNAASQGYLFDGNVSLSPSESYVSIGLNNAVSLPDDFGATTLTKAFYLYERSNTSDDNTVLIHITYEVNAGKVYTGSVDVPFRRTLDDDQSWVNVERNHLYTVVLGNGLPVGGTAQASLLVDEWNTVSMEEPMTEP